MAVISRREFLRTTPALFLAPRFFCRSPSDAVRIALVYSPEYQAVRRGAEVAAAEAQRAAALLKREFFFAVMAADELSGAGPWTGIITATSQPVSGVTAVPLVDVTGRAPCTPNMLQLQSGKRDCPPAARCVLWHHSLDRFGAEQLNARFAAAGIDPITEQTWLGWFAVKILWESTLRGKAPNALSYDGHKGVPLRFGGQQLVQPIYILSDDGQSVAREMKPPYRIESVSCL